MARPKYISDLHAAKYDLRYCLGGEKAQMLAAHQAALASAALAAGCSKALLEAAIAKDFGAWIRQEKLPKLPKSSGR